MDVLGHSAPARSARSEFFLASYVKSKSKNWFVLGSQEQFQTDFSKSCPFKLHRKVLVLELTPRWTIYFPRRPGRRESITPRRPGRRGHRKHGPS